MSFFVDNRFKIFHNNVSMNKSTKKALVQVFRYFAEKQERSDSLWCQRADRKADLSKKAKYPQEIKVDGKSIIVCSSWEAKVYRFLHKVSPYPLLFADGQECAVTNQNLGKFTWNPDFIIGDTIIEVKGQKQAKQKFFRKQLPAFKMSHWSKKYDLYLCDTYTMKNLSKCADYNDFLSYCKLVNTKNISIDTL